MFVDFNILNQLGSPSINSNTFANRPAAGQTGRLFVSTDTFELYRDNGTGWDLIGGPGSSTVTGSGAAGQVTYWTGTSTIGGNNNLFWDNANSRLGIGTATPGTKLDVHTTAGAALQLNSTNAVGNIYSDFQNQGTTQYRVGYTDDADINYRRFGIYDSIGAKETITIDQQSRYVGINYQYSSLADQPQYTLDVSGSTRATDSSFFVTSGTGQVGINTTNPTQATALIEAVKTDGYGLFLNYATASGSGSTATALWALNTTAGSGYAAVIEEKTANTTGGQYPLLIKHSLSSGTAGVGIGTGLHFALPDSTGTFKTTQLTVETTDAAAATYTTRYRFMAQVNGTSTALAYLTSVGLGIGNVIPSYKLDVNGTIRAFGAGNTGNYLAVDTNPGGATVQLNPQYGTGLPILQSVGSFPLLFGTNNTENARFTTAGSFLLNTTTDISGVGKFVTYFDSSNSWAYIVNNTYTATTNNGYLLRYYNNGTEIASIYAENNSSALFSYVGKNGIAFLTGSVPVGTERARFTSGGNFLIGTTTDAGQKLQVNGTSQFSGQVSVIPSATVGISIARAGGYGSIYGSNDLAFETDGNFYFGVYVPRVFSVNSSFYVTAAGRTGIGTSTPTNKLTVTGVTESKGADNQARFEANDTNPGGANITINAAFAGAGTPAVQTQTNSPIIFAPNSTERARITAGGNFLIGTTTDAGEKLQVAGRVYVKNAGSAGYSLISSDANGATYTSNGDIQIYTNDPGYNINFYSANKAALIFQIANGGSIKTAAPSGGTAAAWKLGSRVAATVVVNTTEYIEVDIGGTLYKLATVT